MADQVPWHLSGDYFENCSCSIVCPCLVSAVAPLTSRPTEGFCNVPLIFHIESGRYGDIALDGLNVLVILHAPGVMADGDRPCRRCPRADYAIGLKPISARRADCVTLGGASWRNGATKG
jgi:hypothetical protein